MLRSKKQSSMFYYLKLKSIPEKYKFSILSVFFAICVLRLLTVVFSQDNSHISAVYHLFGFIKGTSIIF
jgi:hypothetical protein